MQPVDLFPEHLWGKTMCGIIWCYTGPLVQAAGVFKPIRSFKTPVHNDMITKWTKDFWQALHPFAAKGGGAYVNFMMDEGLERVKDTYGDNYERLVAIKNKYDPTNLFRVNQNIKPSD